MAAKTARSKKLSFSTPIYKVLDWVKINRLVIKFLCSNPHPAAMSIIENYISVYGNSDPELDWALLSENPAATDILRANFDKIEWFFLCFNESPCAINILRENPDKIIWYNLSSNAAAIPLIRENLHKIDWREFSTNTSPEVPRIIDEKLELCRRTGRNEPILNWSDISYNIGAVPLLEKNPDRIHWKDASPNPGAIPLIRRNMDKIDFDTLSLNPSPDVLPIFEKNLPRLNTRYLSENPAAVPILEKHPEYINWSAISINPSPDAMRIIEKHMEIMGPWEYKLNWWMLSRNPAAAKNILGKQTKLLKWNNVSLNTGIFEYDYKFMRTSRERLHADLVAWYWSPRRVAAFLEGDGGEIDDLEEM